MKKIAIIVAGGKGIRMGGDEPKQFQLLKGKPLVWHSINAFTNASRDIAIIVVLPPGHLEKGEAFLSDFTSHQIRFTAGGESRFHSVKNGLQLVDAESLVFVHDAVRCLVTADLIKRCGEAAMEKGNAVPAIIASDSIRIETVSGNEPIDRNKVKIIQTPQVFQSSILKKAFEQPFTDSFTDEASVVEASGVKIHLVEGEKTNIKITTPMDLMIAEKMLQAWK